MLRRSLYRCSKAHTPYGTLIAALPGTQLPLGVQDAGGGGLLPGRYPRNTMQNKKLRCFVILKDQPSLAIFKILGYGYPIFNSLITLQHTQNCIPYNIQAPAAAPVLSQESGQGRT